MSIEVHRITWQGHADGVAVKTFMPRFPHYLPMRETAGTWWVDLHLPTDARIEYRPEIRRGKRYDSTLDAGCTEIATNPFGARRHHHLLSPAGVGDREVLPLLVLFDGSDYRAHAELEAIVPFDLFVHVLAVGPQVNVIRYDPDSDIGYRDKLRAYAEIAEDRFEEQRFEEFCDRHLSALDEFTWEYFASDRAREAVRRKVAVLFPETEIERFTEHIWGLIQFWRQTERDRLDAV